MKKIKILVLGCNSFLGYNFTKKIIKNNNFVLLGTINKNSTRIKNDKKTRDFKNFIKYNPILHKKKLIKILNNFKPNIIINFIGNSNFFDKSKKLQILKNYNTFKNILKSIDLSKTNIDHFFNIGTSQEYQHSLLPIKESNTLNPLSEYAKSKLKCHKYGIKWSNKKKINFTTLRAFNVIGEDKFKKNIILKLIELKPNEKFTLYQYNAVRDFIFIDDFTSILIKIILNYKIINYNAINVGTGIPIKISYLIQTLSKFLKKELNNNIIIRKKIKLNSNFANIDRLKKIIYLKKFKTFDTILKKIIEYQSKKKFYN